MKQLLSLALLISFHISYSQEGKIYLKNSAIAPGVENIYVYEPPQGLFIPDKAVVSVVYDFGNPKPIILTKKDALYEFSLKVPDSSDFVMFTINDAKNKSIDNNNNKGFVIYLKNKTKEQLGKAKLTKLRLSGYENYALGLNIIQDSIISEIEKLYQQDPLLKKEKDGYVYYLQLKYQKDKDAVKPEIISYANQLEKKDEEKSLSTAIDLYSMLKMNEKAEQTKKIALKKYPTGDLARNLFFTELYSNKNTDEQYILESLTNYQQKFNDTSAEIKNRFYTLLINYFLNKRDLPNINKYERLLSDKINLAGMYNNTAWDLSGGNLSSAGNDLEFAEQISKKSIDIVKNIMGNKLDNDNPPGIQLNYIYYADTYALLMFKQNKYDAAYNYQNEIYYLDTLGMGADGLERYATYMEKVKGLAYTKDFIETQLTAGQNSVVMLNQLQEIYKKLNLPENEFEKVKQASTAVATKKLIEEITAKYGGIKAIDFNLINLQGKQVSLSDYKGKVVVLDFWATWCGPCRASFPGMQKLVNEYKNKDVAFFFIDTWQEGTPKEITKEVSKFITDNNYSFNVLFDYKNDIVKKYKIQAIPAKIVIDKKGDFLSINSSEDNLKALIDDNIK